MNMPGTEQVKSTMITLRKRVEHVDTNAAGVVHFARYPSLLETAILENLEEMGFGVRALAEEGLDLVISEVTMKYAASARFYDWLQLHVQPVQVGAARFRVSGQVLREEENGTTLLLGACDLPGQPSDASICPVGHHPVPDEHFETAR